MPDSEYWNDLGEQFTNIKARLRALWIETPGGEPDRWEVKGEGRAVLKFEALARRGGSKLHHGSVDPLAAWLSALRREVSDEDRDFVSDEGGSVPVREGDTYVRRPFGRMEGLVELSVNYCSALESKALTVEHLASHATINAPRDASQPPALHHVIIVTSLPVEPSATMLANVQPSCRRAEVTSDGGTGTDITQTVPQPEGDPLLAAKGAQSPVPAATSALGQTDVQPSGEGTDMAAVDEQLAEAPLAWSEIKLVFLSQHCVQVYRRGKPAERLNYAELGFADNRKGKANATKTNQAWTFLLGMANAQGTIQGAFPAARGKRSRVMSTARVQDDDERLAPIHSAAKDLSRRQKAVQQIRQELRRHFHIEDDPILHKGGLGYQARFQIEIGPSFED